MEKFFCGFMVAWWAAILLFSVLTIDNETATLTNKAGKLNIPIMCTHGNIYYWDENTKISYNIDKDTLKKLIKNKEKVK